jgi:hypothetical protein
MTRVAFALWFGWVIVATGQPLTPPEAAMQLAARISSQLPRPGTVSLEIRHETAAGPADLSSFRSALEEEMRKVGLPVTATQPETRVRVTISENVRGLLLVAEILSGENVTVVMQPWIAPPASETRPRVKISRRPIWDQPEPVLDFLLFNSEADLFVLSPTAISSFHKTDGKWVGTGVAALSLARPPARDPRGRIENTASGLRVYLPGTSCSGTLQPVLRVNCSPGNETWPVNPRDANLVARWVTDRNTLESQSFPGAFYAASNGWLVTADHRTVDRAGNPLGIGINVGSDLAGLENVCGPNPALVASGASDAPERDHVRVYDIANGQARPASEPLSLAGPITALWPAEVPGEATLVVRNSETGNYEASRLGLACAE